METLMKLLIITTLALGLFVFAGCENEATPAPNRSVDEAHRDDDGHEHAEGESHSEGDGHDHAKEEDHSGHDH